MGKLAERMRAEREALDLSQDALAQALGIKHQQLVDQVERGQTLRPRWLLEAATFFGVRPQWLRGDDDGPREVAAAPKPAGVSIPVRAHVQAGHWRDNFEWPRDDWYHVLAPLDPRFPRLDRFALEVRGESMNRVYPAGSILICARYADLGRRPSPGDRVICLRHGDEGLVEATVKELSGGGRGGFKLIARNDRPRQFPPIRIRAGRILSRRLAEPDGDLEIRARVIASYRPD